MFWTWLAFFRKIIFRFSKRCSEAREQYFWNFLVRTEKNKSMKEFVCFSTTDVFVPVSQLSTRDLFYFLKNLKIKQDFFVLSFSSCSIIRTTSVMIPLFQIFFGTKMFKKMLILECLRRLQSQLWCRSWIFDTSLSERCLSCWLVKEIITLWVLGVKWGALSWHGKSVRCYQTFLWVGFLYVAFATTTLVAMFFDW